MTDRLALPVTGWMLQGRARGSGHPMMLELSVLVTRVPAPDSCRFQVRAGPVKVVFECTFARQLGGCGCPAVTDGLDGFCPAPDNPGSGSRDAPPARMKLAAC
jgi:hypothetical protein